MDTFNYVTRKQGVGYKLVAGFHILDGLEKSLIMYFKPNSTDHSAIFTPARLSIYKPELQFDQDNPIELYRDELRRMME